MKKKNPKDNLEDLFGSYFNDTRKIKQAAGWNVPSDDVWDNIQKELAKEEKPERKFLYWQWIAVAATALLILSVFQLYQSHQQIKDLSEHLVKNDQMVQKIQSDLQALNEQKAKKIEPINSSPIQPNNTKELKENLNRSIYTNITKTTKEATVFNNVNAFNNVIFSKDVNPSSSNFLLEEVSFETNAALVSTDEQEGNSPNKELNTAALQNEKTINTIYFVDKLSTSIPQLELKNRTVDWANSMIVPVTKKRPTFYVAADYSPVFTTVKNKEIELDRHEFFPRKEKQETAFTTGLQFGAKWNSGWSIETGLHFFSIKKMVQHNRIIPYNFLQERLNDNGDYESKVNLQLGSSGGTVDTDISLARSSSSTVSSDANINMDIAFTSKRNYLDVPLIVKKEWAIGSFALSLKAGLLNRFLLAKEFELQQVILDDIRFNSTTNIFRERPTSKAKTNYSAHYLAGIGLEYAFHPELSFYVEPTFTRSMQPVTVPRGANVYTKNKILNIGLRYML